MGVAQNFELNDIIIGSIVSELLTRKLRKQKALSDVLGFMMSGHEKISYIAF